jgi:glycosyltransferase involved in cell wall biosynthesis
LPLRLAKVPVVLARKGLPMVDSRAIVRWAHAAVVDRVLVPARATAQEILKQGWLPKDHVEVIVNGVDSASVRGAASNGTATRLLRADLGLNPDDRHVLSVARLARHKGTAFLIDAIVHVLASHPRARLLLVGRGEMLPLQRQVDELGIRDRVVFLGERWEIGRVLALADCFVLPSLYEGMSTALLEAMAAGVPVVATRVSGNPEVVRDGVTGLLVPPADPVSLAHAISQVLGDRRRAAKMANAAMRHVAKEHDFHAMIDAVEALLRG